MSAPKPVDAETIVPTDGYEFRRARGCRYFHIVKVGAPVIFPARCGYIAACGWRRGFSKLGNGRVCGTCAASKAVPA